MFQGFGLANALEWGPLYLPDQGINPLEDFLVRALPIEIIFPGMLYELGAYAQKVRRLTPGALRCVLAQDFGGSLAVSKNPANLLLKRLGLS
jgi:hypothetical protein